MAAATHAQIEEFLRDNPEGPLWVVVGFASAFGLGWLDERTRGRPVRVLIGDTRKGFARFSEPDRRAAVAFLRRADVKVTNWYKRHGGYETVHAKVWMVLSGTTGAATAALVGSANLTRQGLHVNTEVMTVAPASELGRLHGEMAAALAKSWDRAPHLLQRLGDANTPSPARRRAAVAQPSGQRPRPAGSGASSYDRPAASTPSPPSVHPGITTSAPRPRRWRRWPLAAVAAVLVLAWVGERCDPGVPDPVRAPLPVTSDAPPPDPAQDNTAPAATSQTEPGTEPRRDPNESVPQDEAAAAVPADVSGSPQCQYSTAAGSEACTLLDSLNGVAFTPCDSLPLDTRPLRLTSSENPARYQTPDHSDTVACSWMSQGTYIAGDTIPAGDLRSVNSSVSTAGVCRFDIRHDGDTVVSSDSYSARWSIHALIRLQPGDEIFTTGCGWVPAAAARLDPGSVLSVATAGDYPLIVGTDIAPGAVRVECPFRLWERPEPADGRNWDTGLSDADASRRAPGPHNAAPGSALWLDCPATPPAASTPPPAGGVQRAQVIPGSLDEQAFGFAQTFTLQTVDAAGAPAALVEGAAMPTYELQQGYYQSGGTTGARCRYHDDLPYVLKCHTDSFPPPSVLTVSSDGKTTFRMTCHDPAPDTTGNVQTYQWHLNPTEDAPAAWPATGQFTCFRPETTPVNRSWSSAGTAATVRRRRCSQSVEGRRRVGADPGVGVFGQQPQHRPARQRMLSDRQTHQVVFVAGEQRQRFFVTTDVVGDTPTHIGLSVSGEQSQHRSGARLVLGGRCPHVLGRVRSETGQHPRRTPDVLGDLGTHCVLDRFAQRTQRDRCATHSDPVTHIVMVVGAATCQHQRRARRVGDRPPACRVMLVSGEHRDRTSRCMDVAGRFPSSLVVIAGQHGQRRSGAGRVAGDRCRGGHPDNRGEHRDRCPRPSAEQHSV